MCNHLYNHMSNHVCSLEFDMITILKLMESNYDYEHIYN